MNNWLSKENTTSVNGFFLLIVFFSHIQSYTVMPPAIALVTKGLGQLMVAMFLFHSGYGVMESIRKKGLDYVHDIPKRRVGKVWISFALSVCLFAAVNWCVGIPFTLPQFLLSLLGWQDIGNSNWYIFVILCLYLLTAVSFSAVAFFIREESKRNFCSILCLLFFTAGLFLFLHETKETWWYTTLSAYPFGMVVSWQKEKVENWLDHSSHWWVTVISSLVLTVFLRQFSSHSSVFLLMTVSFCVFVITFTKKVPMVHMALGWVGEHLFECYILMRIPMILGQHFSLSSFPFEYTVGCFVLMLGMAAWYHKVLERISRIVNFSSKRRGR